MRIAAVATIAVLTALAGGCKCSPEGGGAAGAPCAKAADCGDGMSCIERTCRATAPAGGGSSEPDDVTDEARVSDCRTLIRAINDATAKYKHIKAETPVELLRLGDALTAAAKAVGEVELSSDRLDGFRDEYQQMTADLGKAARAAGNSGGDDDKLQAALRTMDSIGPRESRLLDKINRYCGAS